VHFARRHSDADELIEELLEQHTAPRSLLVVSSDHRIQRAARHYGASYIDSDKWYGEIRARRDDGANGADQMPVKPDSNVARDEVAYWVDEFADAPPDEPETNPFPPGYADDILREE
jgi:predicted RNA-binding protein with PIN domain